MTMPDLPDILIGMNNKVWDCTTTGIKILEKQSRLATTNSRQYLLRFPRLFTEIRRNRKAT